ncbi:MAG: lamin tail domain-containing protein [Candidatus Saccharimonadales bacterium]
MAKGRAVKLGIMRLTVLLTGLLLIPFANVHAQAVSPSLLITEVQPQSAASKTEEFVEIYNPTDQAINVSTLQVIYFSAANNTGPPMALTPSLAGTSLKSGGYLLLKQSGYALAADAVFSTNGFSDTGGHIQLVLQGQVVDTLGWGTALYPEAEAAEAVPKDKTITRKQNGVGVFQDTGSNKNDFFAADPSPVGGGISEDPPDVCSNIDGVQAAPPVGYEQVTSSTCDLIKVCHLEVSEISAQPNFSGQEYIELYNSSSSVSTAQLCSISINGGSQRIPLAQEVSPGAYLIMTFASGVIRNAAGSVTLTQSDGHQIIYEYPDAYSGQTVNFEPNSRVGAVSDQPTPGAMNQIILFEEVSASSEANGSTAPGECPAGKYRNPATNRCKNIETAVAILTPCDEDEERNPTTNRCRKVVTASAALTPCAADQERNPETNRCRKVTASTVELKSCEPGQERNPETNRCRKVLAPAATSAASAEAQQAGGNARRFRLNAAIILAVSAALIGYGMYEYRTDLKNYIRKIRDSKARGRPPG